MVSSKHLFGRTGMNPNLLGPFAFAVNTCYCKVVLVQFDCCYLQVQNHVLLQFVCCYLHVQNHVLLQFDCCYLHVQNPLSFANILICFCQCSGNSTFYAVQHPGLQRSPIHPHQSIKTLFFELFRFLLVLAAFLAFANPWSDALLRLPLLLKQKRQTML